MKIEGASPPDRRLAVRLRQRQRMDLLSAVVMATATVATAYSAYQSSRWNGEQNKHRGASTTAVVRVGKLSNLALQKTALHVNLFVHWLSAVNTGDRKTADFFLGRFPEPLKTAVDAWLATKPFENSHAPASPFDMPQYVLPERTDADRWEQTAQDKSTAAEHADVTADRYLLFTIIYASVL